MYLMSTLKNLGLVHICWYTYPACPSGGMPAVQSSSASAQGQAHGARHVMSRHTARPAFVDGMVHCSQCECLEAR